MLISIGILAWNEEKRIRRTLESLFNQSVFTQSSRQNYSSRWEIVVVPNGCTDATSSVAIQSLEQLVSQVSGVQIVYKVVELENAGKSSAWNEYVHRISHSSADLLILIDADIEFGQFTTIESVLQTIQSSRAADVVVDLPLKDIVRKKKRSLAESLSVSVSNIQLSGPPGITGSFYCARASLLRQIWLPVGLSGEDGLLRAMIITNLFRSPIDETRIVRAPEASHYYEAEFTVSGIFRHQVRMIIGTTFNCYLTWDTLLFTTDPDGPGAGVVIRNQIQNDPHWYPKFINNCIRNHGWWALPRGMVLGRFSSLRGLHGSSWLSRALVLFAGLLFDLPVMLYANHKIKSGRALGYW